MHLLSVISLLGTTTLLVFEVYASTKNHQITNDASNFHQLSPAGVSFQRQRSDLQPVSYMQKPTKRLHNKNRFEKKVAGLHKRDYATTLKYLRAAMNSYRKDFVTPPPVELIQLEQQLPPGPNDPIIPPPAPPTVDSLNPSPATVVYAPVSEAPSPPITQIPDLDMETPPLPQFTSIDSTTTTAVEKGNEGTESKGVVIDMEEDDYFDPEEDPDDVGPPPVVNGVPVDREE